MKKVLLLVLAAFFILGCEKTPEEIAVSSVTLSQPSAEMIEGETVLLIATVLPSDATDKNIIWASSKQSVATVSNTGLVTAIAEGASTITASAGGKSATCTVTVSKKVIEVSSIELNKEELSLEIGNSESLVATVKPDDATNKTVIWSSSDDGIVSVDQAGKVTAIKGGEATITASASDKSAMCKVTVTVPVESVSLDKTSITIEEGQSITLVATVKPDDATDKTVSWSSSSESIAKVDQDGKVIAVKEGSATITAKAGNKEATCQVTVQKKVIAVESVSLDRTSATLEEGQSLTLVATVKPDNATNKTVTWSSSDEAVASVDQNGKVTAIKVGNATITVKAEEKQANCKITVQEKPKVSSITFNTSSFNGYIGKDYQVSVSVTPSNAYYEFEWSVSDTRVANIQGNGASAKIHTLDYGVSEIIVKDKISGKTASITVSTTVTDFVWKENTGETYSGYPLITINEGAEHQLQYSCSPSSATHIFSDLSQFVFYEPNVVNTPSSITISENGLVRGVKEGVVGIKATGRVIRGSSGPERVYIKVKPAAVPVQSISLNRTTLTLKEGESETLTATIYPSNASNKTVAWSSGQPGVATVDQNGKVTGISAGSTTITASAGGKSATCTVTVQLNTVAVTSVQLNKTSLDLKVGESETLFATVKPDNATDKTVTWSNSNPSIATVDQNGKVTAVAVGIASISARAGNISASCEVTVTAVSSNIVFADDKIKEALVAAFDTNGDNELSYEEAAAVTTIDNIFNTCKTGTSFNEFQYFTGVTVVPAKCFARMPLLQSITLPESVTSIGSYAFTECASLKSIHFPQNVTAIGARAFEQCSSLASVSFSHNSKLTSLDGYSSKNIDGASVLQGGLFAYCDALTQFVIPASVNYLGSRLFYGCSSLKTIIFENGSKITSLYGNSWNSVGGAFSGCSSIETIVLPETVSEIGFGVFAGCSSLNNINLSSNISSIGGYAFSGCESLSGNLAFPKCISIGEYAFYGCSSIQSVSLSENCTSIGTMAFRNCAKLESISLSYAMTTIENYTFYGCSSLKSITLPSELKIVGSQAFAYCSSLTSIIIPDKVQEIKNNAFYKCTNLSLISLSNSVKTLGSSAFQECTKLTSIVIPESVSTIESYCFSLCSNLTSITDLAISPPNMPYGHAFYKTNDCPIYVPSESVEAYKSAESWCDYADRIQAIPE